MTSPQPSSLLEGAAAGGERLLLAPADRKRAVLEAFDCARESLVIGVFRWEDTDLLGGIERACGRGVRARVLLSERAKGWARRLRVLERWLQALGAEVRRYQEKASKYHAKFVVADARLALVFSFNFTRRDFSKTCDFGLATGRPEPAGALARLFDADWDGRPAGPLTPDVLVTPGDGRRSIQEMIAGARRTIDIADHRLWGPDMMDLLAGRASQGIEVRVLGPEHARGPHGMTCRQPRRCQPHGKLLIVDRKTAVLGSISPMTSLLDHRRELSILTEQPATVSRLVRYFDRTFGEAAAAPAAEK